jgi:SAM-dependent methyltransferase
LNNSDNPALQERVARERAAFDEGLKRERYERVLAQGYVDHHYWNHRYAMVGDILRREPPERALEFGSETWRRFLENNGITPKETICINISTAELEKGAEFAPGSRVAPKFMLMDAHKLDFPDGHFDLVFGVAILHHLDLAIACTEIDRVLKPGGMMIFVEPLNTNPLAKLVRYLTPNARTVDEAAFEWAELDYVAERFDCRFEYEQLLTVFAGAVARPFIADPDNMMTRAAFRFDQWLKRAVPAVGPYYRRVTIFGRKRGPRRAALQVSRGVN